MIKEEIYSPIEDLEMSKNLGDSPVWKLCFRKEELNTVDAQKHREMWKYSVKFDGLIPVQLTKIERYINE